MAESIPKGYILPPKMEGAGVFFCAWVSSLSRWEQTTVLAWTKGDIKLKKGSQLVMLVGGPYVRAVACSPETRRVLAPSFTKGAGKPAPFLRGSVESRAEGDFAAPEMIDLPPMAGRDCACASNLGVPPDV